MAASVTIRVTNDLLPPSRVADVRVRVCLIDGTLVTEGVTNGSGEVVFLLPVNSYDLLFYKQGFSIVQPQRLVIADDSTAVFAVSGHVAMLPEGPDPRYCRVSGSVIDLFGQASKDLELQVEPVAEVLVPDHRVTSLGRSQLVRPDVNGYMQFDLLRGQKYNLYPFALSSLLGVSPAKIEVQAPDLPAIALDSLLFPVPTSFAFSVAAKTLNVGDPVDESVLTTVTHSDGNVRQNALVWGGVKVTNTDGTVVEAILLSGKVALRPLRVGTAVISAERSMQQGVQFLPAAPAFSAGALTVTVE